MIKKNNYTEEVLSFLYPSVIYKKNNKWGIDFEEFRALKKGSRNLLANNFKFMSIAVSKDPSAFFYAGKSLRGDERLKKIAISSGIINEHDLQNLKASLIDEFLKKP